MASSLQLPPRRHRRPPRDAARERRQTGRRVRPALFPGRRQTRARSRSNSGTRSRKAGFLGVHISETYGGGGAGLADYNVIVEETAAQGCPDALAGDRLDLRADHRAARQRGAEARMAARARQRRAAPRLRDHRAERGHQHPQGQHGRAPRRQRLVAHGNQILDVGGRRSRLHPRRCARRRARREGARRAVAVHRPRRRQRAFRGRRSRPRCRSRRRSSPCFSTMSKIPADALVGQEGQGLASSVRRPQSGARLRRGDQQRHRPLRARRRARNTRSRAQRLEHADRRASGRRPSARQGLCRRPAGATDDRARGAAL